MGLRSAVACMHTCYLPVSYFVPVPLFAAFSPFMIRIYLFASGTALVEAQLQQLVSFTLSADIFVKGRFLCDPPTPSTQCWKHRLLHAARVSPLPGGSPELCSRVLQDTARRYGVCRVCAMCRVCSANL